MVKKTIIYMVLINGLFFYSSMAFPAESISSSELINNAKLYDNKTVSYSGEVIGDIMARKEYAWINVNDGKNAIGIWAIKGQLNDIEYVGNYKAQGDLVEITGVFYRSCIEHGGDLDIHAQVITKISPGRIVYHGINKKSLYFSGGLLMLILLIYLLKII